jgi:hypothetical protein
VKDKKFVVLVFLFYKQVYKVQLQLKGDKKVENENLHVRVRVIQNIFLIDRVLQCFNDETLFQSYEDVPLVYEFHVLDSRSNPSK